LVPETDNFVRAHVAADHAVGQARLERLIHDTAFSGEICLAALMKSPSGMSSGTLPLAACSTRTIASSDAVGETSSTFQTP